MNKNNIRRTKRQRNSPLKKGRGKKVKGRSYSRKADTSASKMKSRVGKKFYTKDDIFLSRMASILMIPKAQVTGVFSQRAVSTIRLNNLADNPQKIYDRLIERGVEMEEVPWAPNTYIVNNMDKSELGKMKEYDRGLFYIQNLSSFLPVIALDPQNSEEILDMCAAPGSKTTLIASITGSRARIIANEDDFRRLTKLQAVLKQFHTKGVVVQKNDGRYIGNEHPGRFDKVLLDAPCSGEGLVYMPGEKPLRFWTIKKVSTMTRIQKELILSAYDSLKPGGTLIYSTCTLEPEENEGVVEFLLKTRKNSKMGELDFVDHKSFKDYKPYTTAGITKWSGHTFGKAVKKAVRVIPGKKMQGFFLAKIEKPL